MVVFPVTFTHTCGDVAVWDLDSCERLTALVDLTISGRDYSELAARGVWFAAGVLLALIVAPIFVRSFRFWEE